MNETTRTLSFVGVAVVLAAVAYGTHRVTQPASLAEFNDERSEFYPNFKDPLAATGLRVAAYNEEAARVDVFNVEARDGRWMIPSHHDYPADGEERLANTATSIVGLSREALASTSADEHKRLGLLDPLDETVAGTEGRGDRITLTKGDEVLADYIIGTKIEDGPQNTFHVRRADESRSYRVTLNVEISTKFADWIEPGLLDFRRGDIRELVVDRYSIDETKGVVVPGEQNELSRSSQDDPWKLAELDETVEEVKTATVNEMINALEDLAIVGVRPKPKGLSANLKGESGGGIDTLAVRDLEQKGFFIDSRGTLVSNEGDVRLGTSDGVMYVLRFGEVFTGSDVEIEVGSSGDDGEAEADSDEEADESTEEEGAEEKGSLTKSRYVFITTQFDESYIDPLDEKPVKPEPPEGTEKKTESDEKSDKEEPQEGDKPEESKADGEADAKEPAEGDKEQADPQAEYEKALADYETKLKDWELRETERNEKVEAGQKRVQELNARFADWYYVISAESFDNIRVSRADLVETKESETTEGAAAGSTPDTVTPPSLKPAVEPKSDADAAATEAPKPAADAKPADKPQEAKPDTPPADTPEKPEEKETPEGNPAAAEPPEKSETPESE